jgi:DNA-binding HxlR family transcriptional regulator
MIKTKEEKLAELNQILYKLDDYCSFILAGITVHPEGIGFGELLREIREHDKYKKMSRTALSTHLKHLRAKNLIEKKTKKDSPLKIKPTIYSTSSYFRELSKGFIAQSVAPEDFLPLMMAEDVTEVTQHLMHIIVQQLSDCLQIVLQAPKNVSEWNMGQLFFNMETLMRAYRERIDKKNEVNTALKVIRDCKVKVTKSL